MRFETATPPIDEPQPSAPASRGTEVDEPECHVVDGETGKLMHLAIEEEALNTQRADESQIALIVGLEAGVLDMCARALGDAVNIVVAHEVAAASDLLAVLRPRLLIITARLTDSDGARLTKAATTLGTQQVASGVA